MATKRTRGEAKSGTEKSVTDRLVDEALEDTFPASDPPFFVGGVTEPADTDEADAKAERERHPAKQDGH